MLLNLIIPIISFGIVSIMGLIMTPFFINNFGYEGLGLISNSNALIQSLFFAGGAFTTVYSREYSNAVNNIEKSVLLRELNNILTAIFFIAVLLSIVFYIFYIFKDNFSYNYYALVFLASAIIIISQSFNVFPFAANRLYINSVIDCARTLLRNILCMALFYLSIDNVLSNGWAMILSAVITLLVLKLVFKENKVFYVGRMSNNHNIKNSFWVCINQGGAYIFSFADVFLINLMLGHYIGGSYAVLIQIPVLLKSVAVVAIGSISSFTVKVHQRFEKDRTIIKKIINKVVVFFSFFISLAFILVDLYKESFFSIWLPTAVTSSMLKQFNYICIIMMLLSISSLVNIFLVAWGHFIIPAKATVFSAVVSVLVVVLLYFFNYKLSEMIIFSVIYLMLILKNLICYLYFFMQSGLSLIHFIFSLILSFCVITINFLVAKSIRYYIESDFLSIVILFFVMMTISLPLLWNFKKLREYI